MKASVPDQPALATENARNYLNVSVKSWFVVALAGQWAFALYIFIIYALTLLLDMNISEITPTQGYAKSNGIDVAMFFMHILPAVYLSVFGSLQLIPSVRNRYRRFHRWNGRIFLLLGVSGAFTGLYLQWVTGLRLSDVGSIGITLNGLLILVALPLTWMYAVNKRIDLHRRWAIHSFFLVNGVWTFRLFLMGWYMVNQGPNGNTATIDGPVDLFFSYACYLVPMAIAELYFWASKQSKPLRLWLMTVVMAAGAIVTFIGVIAALMMMWFPRIAQVISLL